MHCVTDGEKMDYLGATYKGSHDCFYCSQCGWFQVYHSAMTPSVELYPDKPVLVHERLGEKS